MATFIDNAVALINDKIKTNGTGAITAPILNNVLQAVMAAMDTLEQREHRNAHTINYGSRVNLNYLWNVNGANSSYIYDTSWDSAVVSILDNISSLVVEGATNSRFCFFTSAEIDYAHSLGTNLTGKVPTGAKFCVINFRKSDNPDGYNRFAVRQIVGKQRKTVRILSIGNSYSQDALAYVPFMIGGICDGLSTEIGILYKDGATLSDHWSNWQNETDAYTYYTNNGNVAWRNNGKSTIQAAIDEREWDVILLQQGSTTAWTYSTYQPYMNNLINEMYARLGRPVKLGWMLVQSRPKVSSTVYTDEQILQHFASMATNAQNVLRDTLCDFVIPVGTAVQNARTTSLNYIGDYGKLTYEGAHLQEGLPCQLAAYSVIIEIAKHLGFGLSGIYGDKTRATSSWLSGKSIPGGNGSAVGATDANVQIAQKCAIMASRKPYEVTDCSNL